MSSEQTGKKFDPEEHLISLRGKGGTSKYLPVQWRLVWLRTEHADAHIFTEAIEITDRLAIFKATVSLTDGGSATGYGSETSADFPGAHIEKAESKAIGRALAALGYGTQFCADFSEGASGADSPVEPRTSKRKSEGRERATPSAPDANSQATQQQRKAIDTLAKQCDLTSEQVAQLASRPLDALTYAQAGELIKMLTNELRERGQARRER